MTTATAATVPKPLPYRKGGEIDYGSLDFNPDEPHRPDDAILQDIQITEIHALLTDFFARKDTLVTGAAIICYDPDDLNVHVSPDMCIAFGVDRDAIANRRIYLPWKAGKPPDWVLEVASPSTARVRTPAAKSKNDAVAGGVSHIGAIVLTAGGCVKVGGAG